MKFTVVFPSQESHDHSYGLVFNPCPAWVQGEKELLNLNPEFPYYQPGSVKRLMEQQGITPDRLSKSSRTVSVLIHPTGSGAQSDLETLLYDLKEEGFWVSVYG